MRPLTRPAALLAVLALLLPAAAAADPGLDPDLSGADGAAADVDADADPLLPLLLDLSSDADGAAVAALAVRFDAFLAGDVPQGPDPVRSTEPASPAPSGSEPAEVPPSEGVLSDAAVDPRVEAVVTAVEGFRAAVASAAVAEAAAEAALSRAAGRLSSRRADRLDALAVSERLEVRVSAVASELAVLVSSGRTGSEPERLLLEVTLADVRDEAAAASRALARASALADSAASTLALASDLLAEASAAYVSSRDRYLLALAQVSELVRPAGAGHLLGLTGGCPRTAPYGTVRLPAAAPSEADASAAADVPTGADAPDAPSLAVRPGPSGPAGPSTDAPVTSAAEESVPEVQWDRRVDVFDLCVRSVAAARTPEAALAVIYGFRMLGAPYACSGVGRTAPFRFDCSSFVSRAYAEGAGLAVTSPSWAPSTRDMVPWDGHRRADWVVPIAPASVLPGDLLLFDTGNVSTRHVVMVLADGLMVHTNRCGDVLHVTGVWATDGSDGRVFLGARRVDPEVAGVPAGLLPKSDAVSGEGAGEVDAGEGSAGEEPSVGSERQRPEASGYAEVDGPVGRP